jgi:SAM-dependent methyltransferase
MCRATERDGIYVERAVLGIVRCRRCALVYVSPRLKNPERVYWGNASQYVEEARLIFEGLAPHHRDPNYLEDLRLIERVKPKGEFLDIGSSMGFFLRHARNRQWRVTGLEPSPSLSAIARAQFGLTVETGFLEDVKFPESRFDVVTMTDVFEHIGNPRATLREVRRILKPDGVVLIKVPNGLFNLFKLRVSRLLRREHLLDIFDSYEHVVHYAAKTLRAMLLAERFAVRYQGIARPVQVPVWHEYVGHYYQYPTPWALDWKRQTARWMLYWLSHAEAALRLGDVGWLAPNIVVIATPSTR